MNFTIPLPTLLYPFSLSDLCPSEEKTSFKKNNAFLLSDLFGHALEQESLPCPGGHEIYNFGGHFLGHHYYNLNLPDLCMGVEKKISKGIMYSQYITYMATSQQKNPCARGMKFTILVDLSLVIITITLSLYGPCTGVAKKIFLRNTSILYQFLYLGEKRWCFNNGLKMTKTDPGHRLQPRTGVRMRSLFLPWFATMI